MVRGMPLLVRIDVLQLGGIPIRSRNLRHIQRQHVYLC